jgi:putative inorganic carbon (HCO3(-)) transporter
MRDILVSVIFFVSVFMAFRRPYVAALLWVWIGLMNPHRLGWGFAYSFPFSMISAVVLVISMMANPGKVRFPKGATVFLLLIFVAWMGITTLGAIAFDQSMTIYVQTLKVLLMTLVVASVVRTREEILGLVVVAVGSVAFFGIKGGIFTILTGGAFLVWGPPSSVIEGNNELAVALIISVPILYYLSSQVAFIRQLPIFHRFSEKLIRASIFAAILLCLISALGSHSRGALLAMGAMGMVLWWRSKSKFNVAMVIVMMSLVALYFMPEGWMDRMGTIGTYDEDSSAMGRINAWTMAINIANDRIQGAGFETAMPAIYLRYAPNPNLVIVAHSIYFQVLGQHGYIGLFLYLLFWFLTYSLAGRVTKLSAGRNDLQWANFLASMSKVSLAGFAVGGAFLSLAYWDFPFYFMVILVCTERLVKDALVQKFPARPDDANPIPQMTATGVVGNSGKQVISTSGSRS